jgi:hypothetical protein
MSRTYETLQNKKRREKLTEAILELKELRTAEARSNLQQQKQQKKDRIAIENAKTSLIFLQENIRQYIELNGLETAEKQLYNFDIINKIITETAKQHRADIISQSLFIDTAYNSYYKIIKAELSHYKKHLETIRPPPSEQQPTAATIILYIINYIIKGLELIILFIIAIIYGLYKMLSN